MQIKKTTGKINSMCKTAITGDLTHAQSAQPWLQAAETARLKVEGHRKKIRLLEEAARTF
jgi:hypothetical protein